MAEGIFSIGIPNNIPPKMETIIKAINGWNFNADIKRTSNMMQAMSRTKIMMKKIKEG